MPIFYSWLILSVAVWATTYLVPGFNVRGFWDAVVVAAVFGILNTLIGWFISLVIIIGTLGLGWLFLFLTHWVANAIVLQLTQSLTSRVRISSFTTAFFASGFISFVSTVLDWALVGR